MAETWEYEYNDILDTYVPGETLPPVKDEWRFRYRTYSWIVTFVAGKSEKRFETTIRPVFKDGVIGVYVEHSKTWMFVSVHKFSRIFITKQVVNVRHRIKEDNTLTKNGKIVIEYKEDEPKTIADTGEW